MSFIDNYFFLSMIEENCDIASCLVLAFSKKKEALGLAIWILGSSHPCCHPYCNRLTVRLILLF
jgi:hypothetical protein